MAPTTPLFASSWVALFSFLRHSLGKNQAGSESSDSSAKPGVNAGAKHTDH
jgi:hypothetical protein